MFELNGYHFNETVYEGGKSVVYRGFRETDKRPIIAKVLNAEYPTREALERFEYQYTIAKGLNLPGVVKLYALPNSIRA